MHIPLPLPAEEIEDMPAQHHDQGPQIGLQYRDYVANTFFLKVRLIKSLQQLLLMKFTLLYINNQI